MKEKLKKVGNLLFVCLVLIIAGILFQGQDAQAETNIGSYKLSDSKPTKKYDVTGDGKADKIEIKKYIKPLDDYKYQGYKIWIDGKMVLKNTKTEYSKMNVFFVKTKKYNYFMVYNQDLDGVRYVNFYRYSGKQLKKCISLHNIVDINMGLFTDYKISSVKANSIKIKISGQTNMLGWTKASLVLKVGKGGKLSFAKKILGVSCYKINLNNRQITPKYLTTTKKIQVYKNERTTKKAFSIKKGSKVRITKMSIKRKKITYYCVTKSGRKGWMKSDIYLFKGLIYAG